MKFKLFAPFLALLLSASGAHSQGTQASPVVGILRLSSLSEIQTAVGSFAENVQPGSGAATQAIPGFAEQLGIDLSGEILAVLLNPSQSSQPFGIVLPVTDPAAISQNPSFGFQPASKPDVFKMMVPGLGQQMFASFEGKKLILGPLEANVEILKPLIRGDAIAPTLQQLRTGGGQLALTVSIEQLYSAYKPMLDVMLKGMRSQAPQGNTSDEAQNPAAMMRTVESATATLGEVKGLGLRLTVDPKFLNLSAVLQAKPGSNLSTLLNLSKGSSVPSVEMHHPESAVLGTFSMKPTPEFITAYNNMLTAYLDILGDENVKEASSKLVAFMNDFFNVLDGTGSFGMMSPSKKGIGAGVYGITDSAKAVELIKQYPGIQNTMSGFNAKYGLEISATLDGESKSGDTTFLDMNLNHKATSPAGEEVLQQMKTAGMGEKLSVTYAVTPRQIVQTMGEESRQAAENLLAGVGGGASVSPKDYGFTDNPNFFMAFSIPRLMKWIAEISTRPGIPKPPASVAGRHGAAMAINGNGNGEFQFFISAQEIADVIKIGAASGGR